MLPELLPLFTGSLEDSMPSVRQGAAASLATLVTVYGEMWTQNMYSHVWDSMLYRFYYVCTFNIQCTCML